MGNLHTNTRVRQRRPSKVERLRCPPGPDKHLDGRDWVWAAFPPCPSGRIPGRQYEFSRLDRGGRRPKPNPAHQDVYRAREGTAVAQPYLADADERECWCAGCPSVEPARELAAIEHCDYEFRRRALRRDRH